ncbi:flagellar hook-basal body complex protein FliE [Clostridium sp. BJN0001]|uniref:flagellar hook-basal body complex protein FliE n=1 Tax=Clostridium sp. BJN0001 TaxID=2930219 RepID=UPI001FD23CF5|nr:flagellar hook-basal body complex protein FliE [Clostridium sp. BJN0001]
MEINNSFANRIENFNTRIDSFNNKINGNQNNDVKDTKKLSFSDVLKGTLDNVNGMQVKADTSMTDFISGGKTNIGEAMINNTEASLGLQFLTATRDKLLEGYKELTKMQL